MDKVDTEENKVEELVPKRGRGRPKTKIDEPKEPQRRGPKGDKSKHKEYYSQYYRDNYQMFLHLALIVINLFRNVNYQGI